jgi:hypothetical protein
MRKAILAAAISASLVVPTVRAGTAIRLEIEGLVDQSALVFEGHVLTARTFATPNGRVETEYVVSVHRNWVGLHQGTRTFRLPGGVLPSGAGLTIAGMPSIVQGERAIFFLTGESPSGIRMPVGLAQGKLGVVTDALGNQALVRSQRGLQLLEPATGTLTVADPLAALDYQDTVARIEAAAAARVGAGTDTGGR